MGFFKNQFSNVVEWEEFRDDMIILEMEQPGDQEGE